MKRSRWLLLFLLLALSVLAIYYLLPEKTLPKHIKIDRLLVLKSKRKLLAYAGDTLVKSYKIALGRQPEGDKEFEGDRKTPEGNYFIHDKNPNSGYYKNLGISYPDKSDIEHAKSLGKPPGGDIKIHGLRNRTGIIGKFHRWFDWTLGCIAVTDEEMEELYQAVDVGTPIEIRP